MKTKSELRSILFRHLDGITTAPTAYVLHQKGVLAYLLEKQTATLGSVTAAFKANEGYLNVALRVLASQGWLTQQIGHQNDEVIFSTNDASELAFSLVPLYKEVFQLMQFTEHFHPRKFEVEPFALLNTLFKKYQNNFGIHLAEDPATRAIQQQVLYHIEGNLVGPTIVMLGMTGMFHKYFMETSFRPEEFHKNPECFQEILDFLTYLDWFTKKNNHYQFTETGLFYAKRATAYGVTVSYIPTLRKLDELLFGNASILRNVGEHETELHVDREMNVWGSGGAHSEYFKIVDDIIIDLFNRPITEQPKGILDMGCGNGAFLEHIFDVIERQTLRGKMLDDYPLFLVGVDYNEAALKVTRANLIKADIWAKVIWGDIGRPQLLSDTLRDDYGIDLKELLNVRTFLDHNRIWFEPAVKTTGRVSSSTGAFAHRGQRISNNDVEDNLLEHLNKWSPFVQKFGLLIIELHTIAPELTAANLGKTAATAYDATHGFSDQYIVEIEVLHKIAAEAGLYSDAKVFTKFPNSDLATVSVNLFKGK
ncbi:class I SAM-dependent methyltransferase [Flavobacterium sedimenticola]|uniref:Class I SAM-dependent methyltransferase n=1 Tax=Flavobacterium sedimenticola TaxID=3043286 RepID=A0ABT6XTI8_9FLAO|nr:class I SAM-dependent methyltransferase [Flavobacterium sedimenticola]MDI9258122.1 class I SAM-dependent methyltransferase [Flavobacterium sedimenticola]